MIPFETTHARGKSHAAGNAAGRRRRRLLLLLSLLLLFSLVSTARAQGQDAPATEPQEGTAQTGRPGRNGVNLLLQLNLTPEQRTQLREIRAQSEQQARALTRRLNVARRALDEAIYADDLNEPLIEDRAREMAAAQTALLRLRAQTELRVRRVLTPGQLQSFRDLRQSARQRQRAQRRLERGIQQTPRSGDRPELRSNNPADAAPGRSFPRLPRARRRP
ncbi:MAG: Spy/CpxP family protein refolding chaperone [Acidobacteria bacterium]|nr:Spy/CpxP family protein refolding chaperone [Acidobacteriota bacterium]